jgi:hypothetical protein
MQKMTLLAPLVLVAWTRFCALGKKWNHGSDLISPLGEAGEIDVKLATLLDRVLKPTGELAKGVPVVSCGQLLHCERSESIKKTQYFLVLPGKSSKYIRDAVYIVLPSCLRLTRNMISVYIYICRVEVLFMGFGLIHLILASDNSNLMTGNAVELHRSGSLFAMTDYNNINLNPDQQLTI